MYKIFSYAIIRSSTSKFEDLVPYCSAIVEREDGTHFPALLAGFDGTEPIIGQEVYELENSEDPRFAYTL